MGSSRAKTANYRTFILDRNSQALKPQSWSLAEAMEEHNLLSKAEVELKALTAGGPWKVPLIAPFF